jgi:hypothetical protein
MHSNVAFTVFVSFSLFFHRPIRSRVALLLFTVFAFSLSAMLTPKAMELLPHHPPPCYFIEIGNLKASYDTFEDQ